MTTGATWSESRVGHLADYYNGFAFKPEQWSLEGMPIIRIQNISDRDAPTNRFDGHIDERRYLVTPGTILVSWSASLTAYVWPGPDSGWLNQHIFKVVPRQNVVLPSYYPWLATWFLNELDSERHGSTMTHLTWDTFSSFKVPLPDLETQSRLANYLDTETARIDSLIDRKKRFIDLLLEKRTALISNAVTQGFEPNAEMRHSGVDWLGSYPSHWQLAPLRHVIKRIEQGWSPQCENRPAEQDEWGVLKAGAVNGGVYRPGEHKALPADLDPVLEYVLQPGDFIVSRANTRQLLGSAGVIPPGIGERRLLCDKLFRFIFVPGSVDPHYLAYVFGTPVVRYQLERDATGASGSMQNIGQDTLRRLLVALPEYAEQVCIRERVDKELDDLYKLVVRTRQSIDLLHEYRTALISAAVTGQIDIPGTDTSEEVA